MPRVSVVIRAKNEARYIGETLAALQGQQYHDLEVIVVDSGSTDRTLEIAGEYRAKIVTIDPNEFTYGSALNLGIANSQGQLLVSLSAHATPETPYWLGSLVRGFGSPSVAGVYGRHIPRENVSFFELLGMQLSGVTSKEPRLQTDSARFSNANGAVRRDLWELHPFNDELPGAEDIDWARQMQHLGYVIAYEPGAAVYHSHGESLPRLIKRQLHDQPVIVRAWARGMIHGYSTRRKSVARGRELTTK